MVSANHGLNSESENFFSVSVKITKHWDELLTLTVFYYIAFFPQFYLFSTKWIIDVNVAF